MTKNHPASASARRVEGASIPQVTRMELLKGYESGSNEEDEGGETISLALSASEGGGSKDSGSASEDGAFISAVERKESFPGLSQSTVLFVPQVASKGSALQHAPS